MCCRGSLQRVSMYQHQHLVGLRDRELRTVVKGGMSAAVGKGGGDTYTPCDHLAACVILL